MMNDIRLTTKRREEMLREIETNRLARRLRVSRGGRISEFAREVGRDLVRLSGVFRRSEKVAKGKGRF